MAKKSAPGVEKEPNNIGKRVRKDDHGMVDAGTFEVGNHYTLNGDVKSEQFDNAVLKGTNVKLVKKMQGSNGVLECIVELGNGLQFAVEGGMLTSTSNVNPKTFSANPTPQDTPMEENFVAEFSLVPDATAAVKDGVVPRKARLFPIGNFPDKKFSLTREEADAAVKEFTGCELDLEHMYEKFGIPTLLTGKLGKIKPALTIKDEEVDGKPTAVIFGELDVPEWLDKAVPEEKKKLSMAWNPKTKRIIGCSWTLNPRIPNAELVTAFNAYNAKPHDDPNKSTPVQANDNAPYKKGSGSPHGPALMQQICDMAEAAYSDADTATFNKSYIKALEKICEICADFGAKKKGAKKDDAGMDRTAQNNAGVVQDSLSPTTAFADDIKKANDDRDRERMARIEAEAVVFCNSLIDNPANMKATPAQRDSLKAAYIQAAIDDVMTPVVFNGQPGESRVAKMKKAWDAAPKLQMTQELLKSIGTDITAFALPNPTKPADPNDPTQISETRIQALMKQTGLGQRVLETNGQQK